MKLKFIALIVVAFFVLTSCMKKENAAMVNPPKTSKADSMKTAYIAFITAWNAAKVDEFDKYIDTNCLENYEPMEGIKTGMAGLKEMSIILNTACPDIKTTIKSISVEGNNLNISYKDSGTNTGAVNGLLPTKEPVSGEGNYAVIWQNGKFHDLSGVMEAGKVLINAIKVMQDYIPKDTIKTK